MQTMISKFPTAVILAVACATSTLALAQDEASTLATKLAQMQLKTDGAALADRLTAEAVQVPLANWTQRVEQSVPPERQNEVRDQLNAELQKFAEKTHKAIEAQVGKAAQDALIPVFKEKLTEDEMKIVIAYLESAASAKFQSVALDAGNAWIEKVFEATKTSVENNIKSFDAAATRIVGAPAGAAPSGATSKSSNGKK